MKEIELNIKPCVKCGFCCTITNCEFGTWNPKLHKCNFLSEPNSIGQRFCTKYEEIKKQIPYSYMYYPAFGAGCSSTIGNSMRNNVITNLINNKNNEIKKD